MNTPFQRACFLAASCPHSGDWLFDLPIASCGFQLDDEAVRGRGGLGIRLALPFAFRISAIADNNDAFGIRIFVCKRAPGRIARHQALNEVIARAFQSAGIPATKEPNGLSWSDGKRPDGLTLIPWQEGKPLCWDVTVACPVANSYIQTATGSVGAVAEIAATRKSARYGALESQYCCKPLLWSLHELRCSTVSFRPHRETSVLFQRISV